MSAQQKVNLQFDAGEWIALCELAQKHRTDVGALIRIGAVLLLEAEQRGLFRVTPIDQASRLMLPPGRTN